MNSQIEKLFENAESRYLKPEELDILNHYVSSLPERLEVYRRLRDEEISIMQHVADQLQAAFPQEKQETLERCLKNALLVMRYCAMSMLLDDESFVQERLLDWLSQTLAVYNSQAVDATLYRLLNQAISQAFTPAQINLIKPSLSLAQRALLSSPATATSA